jgi:hypothetical protein
MCRCPAGFIELTHCFSFAGDTETFLPCGCIVTLGLNAIDLFDKFSDAASGQLSLGQAIGAANSLIAIDPALGAAFYGVWLSRAPEDQNTAIGWYNVGDGLSQGRPHGPLHSGVFLRFVAPAYVGPQAEE